MLFLFFHRGLIASSFTETHYLQDGTDISLSRNHTVSPATRPPMIPCYQIWACTLQLFYPSKVTRPDSSLRSHEEPVHHSGFGHCILAPGKLGLGQLCARTGLGGMADLETTFQSLGDAQLGKSFLENVAKVQDGLESSHPWAELSCVTL